MRDIHGFLGVSQCDPLKDKTFQFSGSSFYSKYVGNHIDPERESCALNQIDKGDKLILEALLGEEIVLAS